MSGTLSPAMGPEKLQQIQDALKKLDAAETEVQLAKRAGIHELPGGEAIATAQDQINTARSQLLKIKNVYFPNSP